jgi:4,5-DOPA dioxygenase extradiol
MDESLAQLPETAKMPVLFIGHGSPLNITSQNSFTQSLEKLGRDLPRPRAIMVISAHWLTSGSTCVCGVDNPRTIYDFSGFPEELYQIRYAAPGSPDGAMMATSMVKQAAVQIDQNWGLDHASWAILKHMYPSADIPVFEMSLDYAFGSRNNKPIQYHHDLAEELQGLRTRGILIIGSGNIVHNLREIDYDLMAKPFDWAVDMDEKVKRNLIKRDHEDLVHYLNMGRTASLGIPTLDHYLPMVYTIALQGRDEALRFIHEGFQNGSVSMRCFQIG